MLTCKLVRSVPELLLVSVEEPSFHNVASTSSELETPTTPVLARHIGQLTPSSSIGSGSSSSLDVFTPPIAYSGSDSSALTPFTPASTPPSTIDYSPSTITDNPSSSINDSSFRTEEEGFPFTDSSIGTFSHRENSWLNTIPMEDVPNDYIPPSPTTRKSKQFNAAESQESLTLASCAKAEAAAEEYQSENDESKFQVDTETYQKNGSSSTNRTISTSDSKTLGIPFCSTSASSGEDSDKETRNDPTWRESSTGGSQNMPDRQDLQSVSLTLHTQANAQLSPPALPKASRPAEWISIPSRFADSALFRKESGRDPLPPAETINSKSLSSLFKSINRAKLTTERTSISSPIALITEHMKFDEDLASSLSLTDPTTIEVHSHSSSNEDQAAVDVDSNEKKTRSIHWRSAAIKARRTSEKWKGHFSFCGCFS
jgi:hypothetical protein